LLDCPGPKAQIVRSFFETRSNELRAVDKRRGDPYQPRSSLFYFYFMLHRPTSNRSIRIPLWRHLTKRYAVMQYLLTRFNSHDHSREEKDQWGVFAVQTNERLYRRGLSFSSGPAAPAQSKLIC
jgi:hypothetical protein